MCSADPEAVCDYEVLWLKSNPHARLTNPLSHLLSGVLKNPLFLEFFLRHLNTLFLQRDFFVCTDLDGQEFFMAGLRFHSQSHSDNASTVHDKFYYATTRKTER